MTERALVTGGAGFIGSHLVEQLIADGKVVTVLDNFASGSPDNLRAALETSDLVVVEGSILSEQDVNRAMDNCDIVFHLAVESVRRSLGSPLSNHEVNATGTINVLETARRAGVEKFIYCSSSEVYGNTSESLLDEDTFCEPVTVYGSAKLVGEYYTLAYNRTYGMKTAVVRPFNAYGPRAHCRGDMAEAIPRFVIRVLNGLPPVVFGDGTQGRDFTYVTDIARGLALAGNCDALVGNRVNIAFGEMITIGEVAQAVARLCQRPDLAPVFLDSRPGDVFRLHADTRRARSMLDYVPKTNFEHGLSKYLEWFTSNVSDPATLLEDDEVNWTLPSSNTA